MQFEQRSHGFLESCHQFRIGSFGGKPYKPFTEQIQYHWQLRWVSLLISTSKVFKWAGGIRTMGNQKWVQLSRVHYHPFQQLCRYLAHTSLAHKRIATHFLSLSVFDAWGKIPSGVFSGNKYALGNFDQCLETREDLGSVGNFIGQYCIARPVIEASPRNLSFDIGICAPDTCSPDLLSVLINEALHDRNITFVDVSFPSDLCQSATEPTFSTWDTIAM